MKVNIKQLKKFLERIVPAFLRRRHRRITLEGLMFIVLTMVIGLAALNTGANLLYLILSMMLCLLLLSGVISTLTLVGLRVKRTAPHHAIAGLPRLAELEITNLKPLLSSYSLRCVDCNSNDEEVGAGYIFRLPPGKTQAVAYQLVFPRRGLQQLEYIRISSRFPFGFFERSVDFKLPHQLLVYPQILDVRTLVHGHSIESGETESGRKGLGTSLYGIREYTPQDSARLIHWKVSARARKLMMREFTKEEKKRITIILNNYVGEQSSAEQKLSDDFERAVIIAASFARFLLEQDYMVQLLTASGKVPFGIGQSHLHRLLRALAVIELTTTPPMTTLVLTRPEAETAVIYLNYRNGTIPAFYGAQLQVIDVRKGEIQELIKQSTQLLLRDILTV